MAVLVDNLEKARKLLDNLKNKTEQMKHIQDSLKMSSGGDFEYLYGEEFSTAIEISDIFETLSVLLQTLEKDDEMYFICNRFRSQAELLVGEIKRL